MDKQTALKTSIKFAKKLPGYNPLRTVTRTVHAQDGYVYATDARIAIRWRCPEASSPETYDVLSGERIYTEYPTDNLRRLFDRLGAAGGYLGTSTANPYECLARTAKAAGALSGLAAVESWRELGPIELEVDDMHNLWATMRRWEVSMRVQVGREVSGKVERAATVQAKYLAIVAEVYRQVKATKVTIDLPDGQDPIIFRSAQAEVVLSQMTRR